MYKFAKPFLYLLEAEDAHKATIALLKFYPSLNHLSITQIFV